MTLEGKGATAIAHALNIHRSRVYQLLAEAKASGAYRATVKVETAEGIPLGLIGPYLEHALEAAGITATQNP